MIKPQHSQSQKLDGNGFAMQTGDRKKEEVKEESWRSDQVGKANEEYGKASKEIEDVKKAVQPDFKQTFNNYFDE